MIPPSNSSNNKTTRIPPIIFGIIVLALVAVGLAYWAGHRSGESEMAQSALPTATPAPTPSAAASGMSQSPFPSPSPSPSVNVSPTVLAPGSQPDLSVDVNGLSRATVDISTPRGLIQFKFYPQDAPNTVNRFIELVRAGFYNGLTFHRVVPGFVIQGGDPLGNGQGGSGQKLKAEFNNRRHLEGTVAMARTSDPNSADSQFYITLSPQPQLDHNYTVFGQVIEGMDVVRKIQVGDKMTSVRIEN